MLPLAVKILVTSIIMGAMALVWIDDIDEELVGWQILRFTIIACIFAFIGSILWLVWTG